MISFLLYFISSFYPILLFIEPLLNCFYLTSFNFIQILSHILRTNFKSFYLFSNDFFQKKGRKRKKKRKKIEKKIENEIQRIKIK